jgi:thiamine biosynthesis protein ThiC
MKVRSIEGLKRLDPEKLYQYHNEQKGKVQDRCMLYTFRCAIDYANKTEEQRKNYKLNWWDFKDK